MEWFYQHIFTLSVLYIYTPPSFRIASCWFPSWGGSGFHVFFSYLEVTLDGTEKERPGGEGPVGGAGDFLEVAQEVLRVRGQDEEDDRSRAAAGKEKSACARGEKKSCGFRG